MAAQYSDAVRSAYADRGPWELLRSPVTVLVGVDDEAATAVGTIGIETVHDLATSAVFDVARAVTTTVGDGGPAGDADRMTAMAALEDGGDIDLATLFRADLVELEGIDAAAATQLREALGVETVQDLARWAPYQAARAILSMVTGVDDEGREGIPSELVPTARKYATERTYYTKTYIDEQVADLLPEPETDVESDADAQPTEAESPPATKPSWTRKKQKETSTRSERTIKKEPYRKIQPARLRAELVGESIQLPALIAGSGDRRVDLAGHDPAAGGFHVPAVGGVLQFEQAWIPQGLSLGQLLHSMTLAPAESTKVAVIDWSRRTSGERDEAVDQRDRMAADMTQNRSLQEVQDGVTREVQSGESNVSSSSVTEQYGATANYGLFGMGGSEAGGFAATDTEAETVTNSRGRRDIHAEMSQRIRNATQQHASSSRTRRATVVQETEQAESESVRTRVVTNYNHMHALAVHYYEVVQIFRVEVSPTNATPVLFVPFKPLDFANRDLLYRYRQVLKRAALDARTRELIDAATGYVTLTGDDEFPASDSSLGHIGAEFDDAGDSISMPGENLLTGFQLRRREEGATLLITTRDSEEPVRVAWDPVREAAPIDPPIRFEDIESVAIEDDGEGDTYGNASSVWLHVARPDGSEGELSGEVRYIDHQRPVTLFEVAEPHSVSELVRLLNEEQLHYSQAVWRSLDAQTAATLLSSFSIDDRNAAEIVDATPVATHGNYVAFPLAIPDDPGETPDETQRHLAAWWEEWRERNYDPALVETDLVPLPSGGVHGEAVLGRANGAEKLDITRFWDWQESPIPDTAPAIAPVQTGSRATGEDLTPGGFDAPIIQMQQPQALPAPAGVGAVLDALGRSDVFRDMSGMDAAAEVARAAQQVSGEGASHAVDTAARTFEAAANAQNKALDTISGMVAGAGGGGKHSASNSGNSGFGAAYNEAKRRDRDGGASKRYLEARGDGTADDPASGGGGPTGGSGGSDAAGGAGGDSGTGSGSPQTDGGASLSRELLEERMLGPGQSAADEATPTESAAAAADAAWVSALGDSVVRTQQVRTWKVLLFTTALAEEAAWTDADGKIEEAEHVDRLRTYYSAIIEHSPLLSQREAENWPVPGEEEPPDHRPIWELAAENQTPWSAAFISYCASQAGITRADGFEFSYRHITYIAHARLNRLNQDLDRPFWLYAPDEIEPDVGDILCKNRVRNGDCTDWAMDPDDPTADTIITRFIDVGDADEPATITEPIRGSSHCDIVVETGTDADGTRWFETVGGNTLDESGTANTVGRKRWARTANGDIKRIDRDSSCDVFGFIRIVARTPTEDGGFEITSPSVSSVSDV